MAWKVSEDRLGSWDGLPEQQIENQRERKSRKAMKVSAAFSRGSRMRMLSLEVEPDTHPIDADRLSQYLVAMNGDRSVKCFYIDGPWA